MGARRCSIWKNGDSEASRLVGATEGLVPSGVTQGAVLVLPGLLLHAPVVAGLTLPESRGFDDRSSGDHALLEGLLAFGA